MNRIILIGNGFDLAHGLKTSYRDFIDDFWEKEKQKIVARIENKNIYHSIHYVDEYIEVKSTEQPCVLLQKASVYNGFNWFNSMQTSTLKVISQHRTQETNIYYKNRFLKQISEKSILKNWVDIEEEYFFVLTQNYKNLDDVKILHNDFRAIQDLLVDYLQEIKENRCNKPQNIEKYIFSPLNPDDFIELLEPNKDIEKIIFLNFNYTPTVNLYNYGRTIPCELIHIHGELGNEENPIIFGYGNERDEQYTLIEKQNRNELLPFIKSFRYSINNNYRNVIRHINSTDFQVFIFGHSCGLSDGTLLSRIFEHKNCKSIKIFFYKESDEKDNFNDTYMNISRHFKDKERMREIVISKEKSFSYC